MWSRAVRRAGIDLLGYNQVMADQRATVARFDQWAPGYDASALQPLLYLAVHAVVLDRCAQAVPAPRRLLDVGCGTGRLLRSAASRFPGTGLVGVDVSGGMLSVAAAAALAGTPVVLVRAAAERLPFADAVFDLVTATLTYRHWVDQAAGVAEIGRVMNPGGVFGLAALVTPPRCSPRWILGRARRARLPASLVAALAGAGLRTDIVEEVAGIGPIPEVTFVLARRVPQR
ncbi:MAG TPA: methyltransferase domain-containing protein [Actinophytocola sp.]|uniref:class I SAM-dependent methyltransferase n=1 Tax=Actinophytocola sp. TaxID=1872138 RepID=UPI002DFCC48E|nr:methyltransferase domain-containing protein [Actinophytocola sp.]